MMGVHDSTILTFAAADVLRCVNHAGNAKDWRAQWIDHKNGKDVYAKPEPALMLVKDSGIYLMSAGLPRDPKDETKPEGRSFVAYAKGFNPETDDADGDLHGACSAAVGGDDFAEWLKREWFDAISEQAKRGLDINIRFGQRSMQLLAGTRADGARIEARGEKGATSFVGRAAVDVMAATVVLSGIDLYLRTGLRAARNYTPGNMRAKVSEWTGKTYPRSRAGLEQAGKDLAAWLEEAKKSVPVVAA